MSVDTEQFFGEGAVFQQACQLYRARAFPQKIALHAVALHESRILYCLGWCFASALRSRQMAITDAELEGVARRASSTEYWQEFVDGFQSYEP
jgi:hypothetical protein